MTEVSTPRVSPAWISKPGASGAGLSKSGASVASFSESRRRPGTAGPGRRPRNGPLPPHATYYRPFLEVEAGVRQELVAGRRHLYEAEMK
ncbi:hypothetical protein ABT408_37880, partial [Streptomyces halstedii]